jgi:hypothetical protein
MKCTHGMTRAGAKVLGHDRILKEWGVMACL